MSASSSKNSNSDGDSSNTAIALTTLDFNLNSERQWVVTALPSSCSSRSSSNTGSSTTTLPITPTNTRATPTPTMTEQEPRPHSTSKTATATATATAKMADSETGTESEVTRKTMERKLVRKLDWCLFPCLVAMCMFQAADRGAISIAKINGIQTDLSITQHQFNFALSIFQIGYCLIQIPSNLVIVHPKVHPGIYLSLACLGWSIIGLCHAFAKNYAQLLVMRLLLGALDAPYFVGTAHLLSCWYTKKEMGMRLGLLLVAFIAMMVVLGPTAAAILENLDGVGGLKGWRWVYVVFGSFGAGVSGWGFMMLPGEALRRDGRKVWWLSEDEYQSARLRIEEDRVGEKEVEKRKIWTGFKDAMKDFRMWVFVVMMLSRKSFEGLWNYELPILKSLHLIKGSHLSENTLALLLGIGPATFGALITLATAHSSDRKSERSWHLIVPLSFAGVALAVCAIALDPVTRYVMVFLWEAGGVCGVSLTWAWITGTVQETSEKRAVAIAVVNVVGGLGAIYGPFFFRGKDAPEYRLAFGLLAGHVVLDVCCILVMRWLLKRVNRVLKEKAMNEGKMGEEKLYIL